jgi:hypothetical protein
MSQEKAKAPDTVKFPLTKPIKAHGENAVTSLNLRMPSGEDLIEIGCAPFSIDNQEKTHIDFAATAKYISRLAEIPLSSVKMMSPRDIMSAFGVIAGFFGDTGTTP